VLKFDSLFSDGSVFWLAVFNSHVKKLCLDMHGCVGSKCLQMELMLIKIMGVQFLN